MTPGPIAVVARPFYTRFSAAGGGSTGKETAQSMDSAAVKWEGMVSA